MHAVRSPPNSATASSHSMPRSDTSRTPLLEDMPVNDIHPTPLRDPTDEAIEQSFPASDPPSQSVPVAATLVPRHGPKLYRIIDAGARDAPISLNAGRHEHRWASPATGLLRMATSMPMAILDYLVGLEGPTPSPLFALVVQIGEDDIDALGEYPEDWDAYPYRESARKVGDAWASRAGSRLALRVPHAMCSDECCLLINPLHERVSTLTTYQLRTLRLDPRLRI